LSGRLRVTRRRQKSPRYSEQYVETVSGVAWFDRDQWERLRDVAEDPDRLEDSYDEWVAMAERACADFEAQGMLIERVPVDAEALVAWCNEHERPIDGAARAEFVAKELRRIHRAE
jgi:hypothetical protein